MNTGVYLGIAVCDQNTKRCGEKCPHLREYPDHSSSGCVVFGSLRPNSKTTPLRHKQCIEGGKRMLLFAESILKQSGGADSCFDAARTYDERMKILGVLERVGRFLDENKD